jgi:type VI secretion system secreted protein VgrG
VKLQQQGGTEIALSAPMIGSKADASHNVEAGAVLTLKGAMVKVN